MHFSQLASPSVKTVISLYGRKALTPIPLADVKIVVLSPGWMICLFFEIKQTFVFHCGVENTEHDELLNFKRPPLLSIPHLSSFCKKLSPKMHEYGRLSTTTN